MVEKRRKNIMSPRKSVKHYVQKQWNPRTNLKPGTKNVIRENLIDPKKILLPPLHIKLGMMKQFVKALDKENDSFKYLSEKFSRLSDAKIKEGVFDGPQIRSLMTDEKFDETLNTTESEA